ncbi:hypothetical protein [Micromonospora sp. NPDC005710]|uniref:hypothetical protein n=1 Tax=Micromonospora sp. NPDC005710 TaxID=3157051 RepID=UPI0033D292AE
MITGSGGGWGGWGVGVRGRGLGSTSPADAGGLLADLAGDSRLADDPRLPAARAHLWELEGEWVAAREAYLMAASRSTNLAQQRYLNARAQSLPGDPPPAG